MARPCTAHYQDHWPAERCAPHATSSPDTQGAVGDITSEDSYVYVKTSADGSAPRSPPGKGFFRPG